MSALALLAFFGGLAVALLSSEFLVRGLGRLGAKLGLAAGLLGLLTALGADGPEISSAITALLSGAKDVGLGVILGSNLFNLAALLGLSGMVAGVLRFPRVLVWVDGGIALYVTVIVSLMFAAGLPPLAALLLIGLVFMLYLFMLAAQPHHLAHLPLPPDARQRLEAVGRLIHQDLAEAAPAAIAREWSWAPVYWLLPATVGIVAGSYAMVRSALQLGAQWHVPQTVLGAIALAAITSLPNAYAASRLALLGNGTAVLSLSFNSNTLNLLAGVSIPAVFLGGVAAAANAGLDMAWLLSLSLLAIGLAWWKRGLTRMAGAVLIAGYLAFAIVTLR